MPKIKGKIAYQGIQGANSHLACTNFYPDMETVHYPSFEDIFQAVEKGEAQYGMIPIENSYAGRVAEIHNLLSDTNLLIAAEHFQSIEHNLAVPKGTKLADTQSIYSHPQALMQCHKNLAKIKAEQEAFSNTAAAAKFVAEKNDKTKAAICTKLAAEIYGLEVIKENIEDLKNNKTIFVVIAKELFDIDPQEKNVMTTLLVTVRNIPAAVYKMLSGFATNNINLIKLESYIPGGYSTEAQFFVSFEGHAHNKKIQLALEEVGFYSKDIKLLGIYHMSKERYNPKK
jgi:prephenate dehydratase